MSQFYLNSSAGFILLVCFSLLENGLIIPLILETDLISSPRISLQTHSVSLQSSNIRSSLREVQSGAAQLTPLLMCCWALTLFWAVPVPMLSHLCVREVFSGMCVNWFPGSFYRQKTSPLRRGKWMKGWHNESSSQRGLENLWVT